VLLAICHLVFDDALVDQMLGSVVLCTIAPIFLECFTTVSFIIVKGRLVVNQCDDVYALSCIGIELLVQDHIFKWLVDDRKRVAAYMGGLEAFEGGATNLDLRVR
jgi:hypothetical protein